MEKKRKVVRYGLDEAGRLGVNAISLVDLPAIEEEFIALRAADPIKLTAVDEQRMLYGPVLIPEKEIMRVDGNGDEYFIVFPREVVKEVAHQYLKKNLQHNTTLQHAFPVTGVSVVESWLKESDSDKSEAFGMNVPVGTWLVGMKVDDDATWNDVKEGTFKGFSIEGMFVQSGVEMLSDDTALIREVQGLIDQFLQASS